MYWKQKHSEIDYLNRREVLNLQKLVSSLLELLKLILIMIFVLHFTLDYGRRIQPQTIQSQEVGQNYIILNMKHFCFDFIILQWQFYRRIWGYYTCQLHKKNDIYILYDVFVSTVGTILDKISEQEKMKKVHTINTYIQNKKIGYELHYQVRQYLNYYWQSQSQVESQDEQNIINQLSQNLREYLMLQANSIILKECPLFKNHFSDQLKYNLVRQIKQTVIQPENIVEFDQILPTLPYGQIFMCFIAHGEYRSQFKMIKRIRFIHINKCQQLVRLERGVVQVFTALLVVKNLE